MDERREQCRKYLDLVRLVILLRLATMSLVQLANYQAATFVRTAASYHPVVGENTVAINLLKILHLYHGFGNILSDYSGVALFVYAGLLVAFWCSMHYMPKYYRAKPPDSVDLRMAMMPEQERKRIDLLLELQIEQLTWATEYPNAQVPQRKSLGRRSMLLLLLLESKSEQIEVADCQKFDRIRANIKPTIDDSMRPARYWSGQRSYWRTLFHLLPYMVVIGLAFAVTLDINMSLWVQNTIATRGPVCSAEII